MKKKLIAVLLSVAMTVGFFPALAAAADQTDASDQHAKEIEEELVEQNEGRDPFAYVVPIGSDGTYPAQFDLSAKFLKDGDETSYVTPVKFQNPFGTCWGFAAIAASESSILGSGLAAEDGYSAETFNLSEKHLVYFASQAVSDPTDSQYGEGMTGNATVTERLNMGGQPFYAAGLFSSGMGPNLEDRDKLDAADKDILVYKGREGNVMKRNINGKRVNYCYDDADDWAIPEKYRYYQSYTLKEAYQLTSPAVLDEDGNYTYNPDGTTAIKKQLANKRAVVVGFHADSYTPSQEAGDGTFISKNWAHYTYEAMNANHGVTIVGWDDNYSKNNFIEGHQPPADGAWLVKNSWGSEEETFPNRGPGWGLENSKGEHTGYFWLSYYDKSISMLEALEFDKSNVGRQYYIDQYDKLPVGRVETMETDNVIKMANVFCAEENEILRQVTCQTSHPGTKVTSEVYLLSDNFKDPTDGVLVDSVTQTYEIGGVHKMSINRTDLNIQKGQYYSVVQTHAMPNGQYAVVYPSSYGKGYADFLDLPVWNVGVVNKNESFYYDDNGWTDYTEILKYLTDNGENDLMAYDNFPIKAYCDPAENNLRLVTTDSISLASKNRESGDAPSARLRVTFTGSEDIDVSAYNVTWSVSEGGNSIISVEPDPKDDTCATVTAKKAGKTTLVVSARGIGARVIPVTVVDPELKIAVSLDGAKFEYTGKKIKPSLMVVDSLGQLAYTSDYKVVYKNNQKCGKATATAVPANSYYKGSATWNYKIVPKRSSVTKLKAGKNSFTVTVKNQKKSGVTGYQVQYRKSGTSKWSSKKFSSKKSSFKIGKLKKGAKYEVRVRAYAKGAGYGKYSTVSKTAKIK